MDPAMELDTVSEVGPVVEPDPDTDPEIGPDTEPEDGTEVDFEVVPEFGEVGWSFEILPIPDSSLLAPRYESASRYSLS
jgi:hypothetical protein